MIWEKPYSIGRLIINYFGNDRAWSYYPHAAQDNILNDINIPNIVIDDDDLKLMDYIQIQLDREFWNPEISIGYIFYSRPGLMKTTFNGEFVWRQ